METATPLSRIPDYTPPHVQEHADEVFPGEVKALDKSTFLKRAGMNENELAQSQRLGLLRTYRKPGMKYLKLVVPKCSYVLHLKATATSLR